jgi:peptidoglycan/LPS O-acetylase OafA/YrhL
MVSGYAMSALIADSFPRLSDARRFYVDRFLRLAPQYYFYLAICAFTVLVIGWRETPSQEGAPNAVNVMANLTIIPLTFWMFDKSIGSLILNIPSWSVGLEMCFYLVLPWLLRDWRDIRYAGAFGAGVFALATHGAITHPSPFWHGIIADCFSYRLLPGTLVFFLAGVALQRKDWLLFFTLAAFLEADALSLWLAGKISFAVNMHLLAGAAVGFVMIPLLALLPRNAIDEKIGAASYGAYLSHWIFTSALQPPQGFSSLPAGRQSFSKCSRLRASPCAVVGQARPCAPILRQARRRQEWRRIQPGIAFGRQRPPPMAECCSAESSR